MIKVKNTKLYNGDLVTEGKLVCGDVGSFGKMMDSEELRGKLRPVVISETEEILTGDNVINLNTGRIYTHNEVESRTDIDFGVVKKIIALPEHFSVEQLRMIVDRKFNHGDTVLISVAVKFFQNEYDHTDTYNAIKLFDGKINLHDPDDEKQYTKNQITEALNESYGAGSVNRDEYRSRVMEKLGLK